MLDSLHASPDFSDDIHASVPLQKPEEGGSDPEIVVRQLLGHLQHKFSAKYFEQYLKFMHDTYGELDQLSEEVIARGSEEFLATLNKKGRKSA